MATSSSAIGVSRPRLDGEGKVRGTTRYAADVPVNGLLHARLVPGAAPVLTAGALPIASGAAGRAGQPLARSEVVYSGQPVAMVVAETEAAATDGVDEVLVAIDPLPAVLDLEGAMA